MNLHGGFFVVVLVFGGYHPSFHHSIIPSSHHPIIPSSIIPSSHYPIIPSSHHPIIPSSHHPSSHHPIILIILIILIVVCMFGLAIFWIKRCQQHSWSSSIIDSLRGLPRSHHPRGMMLGSSLELAAHRCLLENLIFYVSIKTRPLFGSDDFPFQRGDFQVP